FGSGTSYFASIMAGKNFGDGKGNITVQAEYNHEQRIFGSDIPWLRRVDGFIVSDVDTGLAPSQHGSDGFPDRVFVQDIRGATISRFGLVPVSQISATGLVGPCGTGLGGTNGGPSIIGNTAGNNGTSFNCNY